MLCWGQMKLTVRIYQDEDGVYIAECPSIPGCLSQGSTEAEARRNISDAVRECLVVRAEHGMRLTVEAHEFEMSV